MGGRSCSVVASLWTRARIVRAYWVATVAYSSVEAYVGYFNIIPLFCLYLLLFAATGY